MGIQVQPNCCEDPLWISGVDGYFYRLRMKGRKARRQWRTISADPTSPAASYIDVAFAGENKRPYLYGVTNNRGIMLIDGKTGDVLARQIEVRGPESVSNEAIGIFNPASARKKHNAVAWIEYSSTAVADVQLRIYKTDIDLSGPATLIANCQGSDVLTDPADRSWVNSAAWVLDYEDEYFYYATVQRDTFPTPPTSKGEYVYIRRIGLDGTSDTLLLDGHDAPDLARVLHAIDIDRDHELLYLIESTQVPNNTTAPWFTTRAQRISTMPIGGGTPTPIVELTETTAFRIGAMRYNTKDQKLYYARTGSPLDDTVHGIRRCNYDGSDDELFMSYREIRFASSATPSSFSGFTIFHFGPDAAGNDYRA